MMVGVTAWGPSSAIRMGDVTSSGRRPSLESSTIDSAAARRSSATSAGVGGLGSAAGAGRVEGADAVEAAEQSGDGGVEVRLVDVACSTAATTVGPRPRAGPGISRSSPAPSDTVVSVTANQSVMTSPSNPHSSRRMSSRNSGCWVSQRPFSRLYAVMMASAPPSRTAISKGSR